VVTIARRNFLKNQNSAARGQVSGLHGAPYWSLSPDFAGTHLQNLKMKLTKELTKFKDQLEDQCSASKVNRSGYTTG